MELWEEIRPYLFIAIYLAMGVLFLVRFRASIAGLLGGFAAAIWVLAAVTWQVLFSVEEPWDIHFIQELVLAIQAANIAGWVLMLGAIATIPLKRNAPHTPRDRFDEQPWPGEVPPRRPVDKLPVRPLAGRGARLGAALVDGLLSLLAQAPGILLFISAEGDLESEEGLLGLALILLGGILVMIPQAILLGVRGQSIGKLIVGVRVVRHPDQRHAGFTRAFLLRALVNSLIAGVPCLGGIYAIVDICFIFRQDQRCIHDMLAGTVVVQAR